MVLKMSLLGVLCVGKKCPDAKIQGNARAPKEEEGQRLMHGKICETFQRRIKIAGIVRAN